LNFIFSLIMQTLFNYVKSPNIMRSASAPYIMWVQLGSKLGVYFKFRTYESILCSPSPGTSDPENITLRCWNLGSSWNFRSIKNLIYWFLNELKQINYNSYIKCVPGDIWLFLNVSFFAINPKFCNYLFKLAYLFAD